jgi:sphingomyelin phosphodiesterase
LKVCEISLFAFQISDIHFDFDYQPGSEADCGQPVCCGGAKDRAAASFSAGGPKLPAGYWGVFYMVKKIT